MEKQPHLADVAVRRRGFQPPRHRSGQRAPREQGAHRGDPRRIGVEDDAQLRLAPVAGHEHPALRLHRPGRGRDARFVEPDPEAVRAGHEDERTRELLSRQRARQPPRRVREEAAPVDVDHQPPRARLEPPARHVDGHRPAFRGDAQAREPAAGVRVLELDVLRDRRRDAELLDRAARIGRQQGVQHRGLRPLAVRWEERDEVLDPDEVHAHRDGSVPAVAGRRPDRAGAREGPRPVGGGDGEIAHGQLPAVRGALGPERGSQLVEPPPVRPVHEPRRQRADRPLGLDEAGALPCAPHLARDPAGELRRAERPGGDAETVELDAGGAGEGGARPRRGERIAGHVHRELDPAVPRDLEPARDAAPAVLAAHVQGHAGERQRVHAALLVDPEDPGRAQGGALLAQRPSCEPLARTRPGGGGLPEPRHGERAVGPPHDRERRSAGHDPA